MSEWAQRRRAAADIHAQRLQAAKDRETRQAQRLIDEFIVAARERGLPTERLRVRSRSGRGSANTKLRGWYLRTDGASGLDTAGRFYVLTADLSLRERLFGFVPTPSAPPLVLGAGGKDGESLDLAIALQRALDSASPPS